MKDTEGYTTEDGRKIGGVLMEMKNITLRFGGVVAIQISALTCAKGRSGRSSGRMARANPRC